MCSGSCTRKRVCWGRSFCTRGCLRISTVWPCWWDRCSWQKEFWRVCRWRNSRRFWSQEYCCTVWSWWYDRCTWQRLQVERQHRILKPWVQLRKRLSSRHWRWTLVIFFFVGFPFFSTVGTLRQISLKSREKKIIIWSRRWARLSTNGCFGLWQ